MGQIVGDNFYSAYLGNQIDLLLAAMAQANPLPSGTDWVAFIDDCVAAQTAAEAAADLAEAWSAHPPYIGANGDWYVWDTVGNEYADSGVDASITVTIADITTIAATATPYVTNTGTATDPVFHLFIPQAKSIVSITKTATSGLTDTYTITLNDGTSTTFTVVNGADGYSPVVTVTAITGGHRVTITDAAHPSGQSFDVLDGGMQASQYDPNGDVASEGGIPAYVAAHGGGGVTSFNSRTGAVTPQSGDYTAAMVGARADTWMPSASDVGADASGSAAAAQAASTPVIGKGVNLLDNWYFGNADSIIDQRGGYVLTDTATYYTDSALTQNPVTVSAYTKVYAPDVHTNYVGFYLTDDTSGTKYYASRTDCVRGYTGTGYGIDRWKITSGTATLTAIGVTLNGTMVQILENAIGTTVTASALLSDGTIITPTYDDSYRTLTLTASNKTIIAVKLELGGTQTLAHQENGEWVLNDPPPNYQQELAKCQRYYFKSSIQKYSGVVLNSKVCAINAIFPVEMIAPPSISFISLAGTNTVRTIIANSYLNVSGFSTGDIRKDGLALLYIPDRDVFPTNEGIDFGIEASAEP